MRISDWSSDVCSSDLLEATPGAFQLLELRRVHHRRKLVGDQLVDIGHARVERGDGVARDNQLAVHHLSDQLADQVAGAVALAVGPCDARSEEHTSELQSLMRISYDVLCLKKKNTTQ